MIASNKACSLKIAPKCCNDLYFLRGKASEYASRASFVVSAQHGRGFGYYLVTADLHITIAHKGLFRTLMRPLSEIITALTKSSPWSRTNVFIP